MYTFAAFVGLDSVHRLSGQEWRDQGNDTREFIAVEARARFIHVLQISANVSKCSPVRARADGTCASATTEMPVRNDRNQAACDNSDGILRHSASAGPE